VGQGTELNCSVVRSRILMRTEYKQIRSKTVQFGTVLEIEFRLRVILAAQRGKRPKWHTGESFHPNKAGVGNSPDENRS
jgi:hypothetical protein